MAELLVTERLLTSSQWRALADAHHRRVLPWVQPRLTRRAAGESHPVDDFLFTYYSYRPAQLLAWHPGLGVTCQTTDGDLPEPFRGRGYEPTPDGVHLDARAVPGRIRTAKFVERLLEATSRRAATFGCFGLHEWAMVYRIPTEQVRHQSWPLRLSADEIAETVESLGPRCTHFDAFRFFTAAARPLNAQMLTRADQLTSEQPGCLHATMDLSTH